MTIIANQTPPLHISPYHCKSVIIFANQSTSLQISGHQCKSDTTNANQSSSLQINHAYCNSVTIIVNQSPSLQISHHLYIVYTVQNLSKPTQFLISIFLAFVQMGHSNHRSICLYQWSRDISNQSDIDAHLTEPKLF